MRFQIEEQVCDLLGSTHASLFTYAVSTQQAVVVRGRTDDRVPVSHPLWALG